MRLTLFAALVAVIGCRPAPSTAPANASSDAPRSSKAAQPPDSIRLTSIELADRYAADEFKADAGLEGKRVEIRGAVSSIDAKSGVVILDTPIYRLGDGRPPALTGVECHFAERWCDDLSRLKEGRPVVIRGVFRGRDVSNMAQVWEGDLLGARRITDK